MTKETNNNKPVTDDLQPQAQATATPPQSLMSQLLSLGTETYHALYDCYNHLDFVPAHEPRPTKEEKEEYDKITQEKLKETFGAFYPAVSFLGSAVNWWCFAMNLAMALVVLNEIAVFSIKTPTNELSSSLQNTLRSEPALGFIFLIVANHLLMRALSSSYARDLTAKINQIEMPSAGSLVKKASTYVLAPETIETIEKRIHVAGDFYERNKFYLRISLLVVGAAAHLDVRNGSDLALIALLLLLRVVSEFYLRSQRQDNPSVTQDISEPDDSAQTTSVDSLHLDRPGGGILGCLSTDSSEADDNGWDMVSNASSNASPSPTLSMEEVD